MASVTQRIKQIKQPHGGYVPAKTMTEQLFNDRQTLYQESIHPATAGLVVDYLFRTTLDGVDARNAFAVSLAGASYGRFSQTANKLLSRVKSLDADSIIAATKLVAYDQIARTGRVPDYDPALQIKVNSYDIENIRTMVQRTKTFFDVIGPVTVDGFTFIGDSSSRSGFSRLVTAGDGDLLTEDTLWDLKVSKRSPSSDNTLQLLMYWLMGLHSHNADGTPLYDGNFQNIKKLGIFNPRLNSSYLINVSDISTSTINEVEKEVIGYY